MSALAPITADTVLAMHGRALAEHEAAKGAVSIEAQMCARFLRALVAEGCLPNYARTRATELLHGLDVATELAAVTRERLHGMNEALCLVSRAA